MRMGEKFDFSGKNGNLTGFRGQIGLEKTKKTDVIIQDQEG
jgi:hypothetical protein